MHRFQTASLSAAASWVNANLLGRTPNGNVAPKSTHDESDLAASALDASRTSSSRTLRFG